MAQRVCTVVLSPSSLARQRAGVRAAAAAFCVFVIVACFHTPGVDGAPGASPSPAQPWTPPPQLKRDTTGPSAATAVPPDIEQRLQKLTLADIVDVALRNNPSTRISWANARAAAASYGAQRGNFFPTIDAAVTGTQLKTVATQGRSAVKQSTLEPALTLSYLLFDFGGRSGSVESAKQALYAADWTHNAAIEDLVLAVETAYFNYMAAKALLVAQTTTLSEADTNFAATQERHRVGVATIADVLQAKTAVSQAQLDLETTQGTLATTRGTLAVSMGLPANIPYDLEPPSMPNAVPKLADSVDVLIAAAMRARPDLAAAEASYQEARANVRVAHATRLPSLSFTGSGGRTYAKAIPSGANSYTLSLGLSIPIFDGFTHEYNQLAAEAEAQAAGARVDQTRQQVVFDVFSSYQNLQTATKRVSSADDLLASAQESDSVALGSYKAGVGSVLSLLTAQSALASARAQQVQARWEWQTALSQLAHDAGLLDVHGNTPIRLAPDTSKSSPPR